MKRHCKDFPEIPGTFREVEEAHARLHGDDTSIYDCSDPCCVGACESYMDFLDRQR